MRDLLHTQISVRIYDLILCRDDWVIPTISLKYFRFVLETFLENCKHKKKIDDTQTGSKCDSVATVVHQGPWSMVRVPTI